MRPLLQAWAERALRINASDDRSGLAWAASAAVQWYSDRPDVSRALHDALRGAYRAPRVAIGGGYGLVFPYLGVRDSKRTIVASILRANAQPVAELLRRQITELQELHELIEQGRWETLLAVFERARAARERHLARIE